MAKVSVIEMVCPLPAGEGYLYREKLDNEGYLYYSDETGEMTPIWNTETTSRAALMLAMATDECRLHSVLKEILDSGNS